MMRQRAILSCSALERPPPSFGGRRLWHSPTADPCLYYTLRLSQEQYPFPSSRSRFGFTLKCSKRFMFIVLISIHSLHSWVEPPAKFSCGWRLYDGLSQDKRGWWV